MATYVEVTEALVMAGYLTEADLEAAAVLLTKYLSVTDQKKLQEIAADSSTQEQMILKAERYTEQDTGRGDPKSLKVDQEIIQDAFNQDEVDLVKMEALESKLTKQAKRAAKAMVSAGLVEKKNREAVASLIVDLWT
jgi:hypothetical protein